MEPISLILAALVAGAVAASKDVAEKGVKDAYEGLKALIKRRFADNKEANMVLDEHEKDPETYEKPLIKKLTEASVDRDAEILKAAEAVLKQDDPEGFKEGKYTTIVKVAGDVFGVAGTNTGTVNVGNVTKGK